MEAIAATAPVEWSLLVDNIRSNCATSMEQLYVLFGQGIRGYLRRQVAPQQVEDTVHDIFVAVVEAIQCGRLQEPNRLMGYVRTIAHRRVAAHIDDVVHERRSEIPLDGCVPLTHADRTPEEAVLNEERIEVMAKTLHSMPPRQREILTRFYLHEQTQEKICEEMHLTATQFRLLKSRAKAEFGERGRKQAGNTQSRRGYRQYRRAV